MLIFQAPWLAAIWIRDSTTGKYNHHCGGSIIGQNYILTAAHCVDHRILSNIRGDDSVESDLKVILGMEKPGLDCPRKEDVEYKIKAHKIHPDFDFPYFDVAILELESNIKYTKGIGSVCLSSLSTNDLTNNAVSLFGWGAKEKYGKPLPVLRGTHQMKVTSVDNCLNKIGNFTYDDDDVLLKSVFNRSSWLKTEANNTEKSMKGLICIEDNEHNGLLGTCKGDSGSPVVQRILGSTRYEQIGIVSGGKCNDEDTPSVLTHIGHESVYNFISKISEYFNF